MSPYSYNTIAVALTQGRRQKITIIVAIIWNEKEDDAKNKKYIIREAGMYYNNH